MSVSHHYLAYFVFIDCSEVIPILKKREPTKAPLSLWLGRAILLCMDSIYVYVNCRMNCTSTGEEGEKQGQTTDFNLQVFL